MNKTAPFGTKKVAATNSNATSARTRSNVVGKLGKNKLDAIDLLRLPGAVGNKIETSNNNKENKNTTSSRTTSSFNNTNSNNNSSNNSNSNSNNKCQPRLKKGKRPPKINIYAGTTRVNDHQSQGHSQMSDKAKNTQMSPKRANLSTEDWDFLYELACQFDKLKLQEAKEMKTKKSNKNHQEQEQEQEQQQHHPRQEQQLPITSSTSSSPANDTKPKPKTKEDIQKQQQQQGDKRSIKKSLAGLFGGIITTTTTTITNYTADGSFLTDAFLDQYMVETPEFSSVTFNFSNSTNLYKRFHRKDQEQRNISQKFVTALLKHPLASSITHLVMSGSLLPDAFLEALADHCIAANANANANANTNVSASTSTNSAIASAGLPMLQVLNLESNLLGRDGIAALSRGIADPNACWPRLQVLKLANQQQNACAELGTAAEELLGDAIVRNSTSLVVVGLHVRAGIPRQQIESTVRFNVDKLRQARRKHASKAGTLAARKRNEMEQYFDTIAATTAATSSGGSTICCTNDSSGTNPSSSISSTSVVVVDLTGNLKFLGLNATERTKAGAAFGANTTVKTVKMVKLELDDDFAKAFGASLATNTTIETVVLDSNSFSGTGIRALLKGLGANTTIVNFQIRHQSKTVSSSDEETLPALLRDNKTLLKLGIDARNPLIRMQLDRKTNENREYQRKLRVAAKKK